MKKIILTLTSEESKRLIAKYIAAMPEVIQAMKAGIIDLQLSSTNGYIYEELSGNRINKSAYLCGCLTSMGGCQAYLPASLKRERYFDKGVEKQISFPEADFDAFFQAMGPGDIIIKSGNLLDKNGNAVVFTGEPSGNGGEWGKALHYVMKNNIQVLIPMTLNKSALVDSTRLIDLIKVNELDWDCTHIMADCTPLPGKVVTEIDAIHGLSGADALVCAMNGVGTGDGTVSLFIFGENKQVDHIHQIVTEIKGEPKLTIIPRCGTCMAEKNHGKCIAQVRSFTRGS